jgi:hypothetical protein
MEEKQPNNKTLKRGALLLLILAFILFNVSKLFNYIGSKHTVDTVLYPTVRKTSSDSLIKEAQKKIDSVVYINDSMQKLLVIRDTELKGKSDTIAKLFKKKTLK